MDAHEPEPDILTADEVAQLLRISSKTIRQRAHDGDIPCRKVGREYRFSRKAVLEWLLGAEVRATFGGKQRERKATKAHPSRW